MKRLNWLLLIFSATMNTSISGGSLLQKSIFSWFPYLHKTLVAVKEQDVHISLKYTCVRVMIMEGVKQQRHKKKQQKGKSLSLCFVLFCFVLFWNHKSHSCYPKVTFDIYSLCYCFKRWPPKEKQGLGKSYVIPVNGSTPPKLVCWVE